MILVTALTQEILDADANAVVITDGIQHTLDADYRSRILTFQAAKGRNGLEANNIYVIVTCPAPAVFQRLNVLGQWLGRDDVIETFYQDQIDQAVGRNRGFRHRGNSKSVVIMSPRTAALLRPKLNYIPGRTSLYLDDTDTAPWLV
jgi:hypothetical protein